MSMRAKGKKEIWKGRKMTRWILRRMIEALNFNDCIKFGMIFFIYIVMSRSNNILLFVMYFV